MPTTVVAQVAGAGAPPPGPPNPSGPPGPPGGPPPDLPALAPPNGSGAPSLVEDTSTTTESEHFKNTLAASVVRKSI